MAATHVRATAHASVWRPIALATALVGIIDGLDAVIFFGLRSGVRPGRIFQGIAAGLLGPASFQGGTPTVVLGVALHFTVALGISATYILASRLFPSLQRRPVLTGPLYGIAAYAVMNFIVIPLSAIGPGRFNTAGVINGLLIHAIGIGLPIAIIAARSGRNAPAR